MVHCAGSCGVELQESVGTGNFSIIYNMGFINKIVPSGNPPEGTIFVFYETEGFAERSYVSGTRVQNVEYFPLKI